MLFYNNKNNVEKVDAALCGTIGNGRRDAGRNLDEGVSEVEEVGERE